MNPDDLAATQQGMAAQLALEFTEMYRFDKVAVVMKEMCRLIEVDKKIDPDMAVQAWYRVYSVLQLEQELRRKIRQGKNAGHSVAADM